MDQMANTGQCHLCVAKRLLNKYSITVSLDVEICKD